MKATALVLLLAVMLAAAGAVAPAARADGDPASDVLVSQALFVPADAGLSSRQQAQLSSFLAAAKGSGLQVRVAVIPDAYDLGSVAALWRKPGAYAEFLGIELSLVYKQALLVVMPNGVGLHWPEHATAGADRVLARLVPGSGAAGIVAGTEAAVRGIAATDGIAIAPPRPAASRRGSEAPIGIVVAGLAGLLVALLALGAAVRRRRSSRAHGTSNDRIAPPAGPAPVIARTASRRAIRLRWAAPGLALVCCAAIGAPILIVSLIRRTPATTGTVNPSAAPSAFTWRPGKRPAPNFRLVDQSGHPVSLETYRGKPVIVTFIDPLCRNLCPLAAQVLDQVDRQLPPSQRLPIIAVSVDVWADTRANLLLDFQKWRLVPEWRWAVGAPKQLAAVWRRWRVGVSVTTKRIAGTTVHFITHDEFAFLVDGGSVRALFVWPYEPRDIETELHRLSAS
jgi:cytochrome oxidase Cu insertion factor (SCO1/SenC/PrrC family)